MLVGSGEKEVAGSSGSLDQEKMKELDLVVGWIRKKKVARSSGSLDQEKRK